MQARPSQLQLVYAVRLAMSHPTQPQASSNTPYHVARSLLVYVCATQVFDKWADDSDSLAASGSLALKQVRAWGGVSVCGG